MVSRSPEIAESLSRHRHEPLRLPIVLSLVGIWIVIHCHAVLNLNLDVQIDITIVFRRIRPPRVRRGTIPSVHVLRFLFAGTSWI